jgi:hypothetical protein
MERKKIYEPEAAGSLFEELQDIIPLLPDYRKAYRALNWVFLKALDQKTDFTGIRFAGPFAKTDYLLKEYKAPKSLRFLVNDARVRFRQQRSFDETLLADNFWYDFQAVCQFVGFVFQVPVPGVLEARFPERREVQRGQITAECLRVIVNHWDDTFLYADADAEGGEEVKVFYGGKSDDNVYKDWNWEYLSALLTENCQLNLVRPREKDGVLYPELIIFEPDYLVDISAIAACFDSETPSPLNHLLNKLKPAPNTSPILLGNLASQFLDEGLYLYPNDCPYVESVQRFFQKNALSLLTAGLESDFHTKAQQQKQHIQDVLHHVLPEVFKNDGIRQFDASEIIVEPSFFSEMLGIQGRMDFLQLDQKILIEQKAGKAGFPEQDPPKPQEKHYVQLLLYMLLLRYNNRTQYEKNARNIHCMLLYSKYREGLIDLGFAPELVFEALKVRNELVANEFSYTHGNIDVLTHLITEGPVKWKSFQKTQIEALLAPIKSASALERAYFLRFLTFLETEHLMAKVGNRTTLNAGFADKWHSSLEEKLLAGNIYCDLELISPSPTDEGMVEQVILQFADKPENEISNFRPGDIVILYPYAEGTEPDIRQTMVFRATIERIQEHQIFLRLRSSQANTNAFWHNIQSSKQQWAIEHDFFESSFSSLYRAMHTFLSAPQERKNLLLLQREPQCDKTITLKGDYGRFNDLALKARQAKDLFIIIGPPGTGKTSYGLLNTLQEELLSSADSSVLLLSYTNRAVDEICSKLTESGIEFIRIGGRFSCEEAYRPSMLDAKVQSCSRLDELRQLISQTRVFVGTTTAFNSNAHLFRLKTFSLAIIDEASQILEPHLVGILGARSPLQTSPGGGSAISKFILIGDHKQLPAVVQQKEEESAVDDPLLNGIHLTNCRLSLFERLLKQYRDNPDVVYMLTRQGRMHPDIAQFPNHAFYQDKLQVVPCPHQIRSLPPQSSKLKAQSSKENGITDLLLTHRIAFIAVDSPRQSPSDKVNTNEAQAIAATVIKIYELHHDTFSPTQTVGVIVPYRNQIAEVRKALEQYHIDALHDITIDTVERYQGSQRDYIVYGFTVQKYYQLEFLTSNVFEEDGCIIDRKLNVAITRAREHLLMFGNPRLLSHNITFSELLSFVRERNGYFSVELSDYLSGNFKIK